MNKRTALLIVPAVVVLLSALFTTQFVKVAKANFKPFTATPNTATPTISITAPTNGTTDTRKEVPLAFSITKPESWGPTYFWLEDKVTCGRIDQLYYSVDAQKINDTNIAAYADDLISPQMKLQYSTMLPTLSEGTHIVKVTVVGSYGYLVGYYSSPANKSAWLFNVINSVACSQEVTFTVDSIGPNVQILSPANQTYDTTNILLNFTVNEPVLEMSYSLDAQTNVAIAGNISLPELSYGTHNITIYTTDIVGNTGASETIYFTISKEIAPRQQTLEPSPTTWAAAVVASVTGVSIGLLFYLVKSKKKTEKKIIPEFPA